MPPLDVDGKTSGVALVIAMDVAIFVGVTLSPKGGKRFEVVF